jgi:hypothetical protein
MDVKAVSSMNPNKLKRHLEIVHAECVGKTPDLLHKN